MILLGSAFGSTAHACEGPASICFRDGPGSIPLIRGAQSVSVLTDETANPAVRRVADSFAADVARVGGKSARRISDARGANGDLVIIGVAGEDAAVVLADVQKGKGTYGYNAATGEYGDLIDMGVLDPTNVTRLALQNAASVAGLLLTTEVMVAEAPKDEEHKHGGMPDMGGMGGMDM